MKTPIISSSKKNEKGLEELSRDRIPGQPWASGRTAGQPASFRAEVGTGSQELLLLTLFVFPLFCFLKHTPQFP